MSATYNASSHFSERGYFHYVRLGMDEPLMADYSPLIARAKGPMVYRLLRRRIGHRVFFGTIRALAREYAGRSASLSDLRQAFLAAVPRDTGLGHFFEEWLDRPGTPILHVTWEEATVRGRPQVRVRVVQRGDHYQLPLDLVVDGTAGSLRHTVPIGDSVAVFVLAAPGVPTGIRLDPDHKVLLWRAEFGPPPGAPDGWPADRWRAWLADQARWLMDRYDVDGVTVTVADADRVEWSAHYGDGLGVPEAGLDQRLTDRLTSLGRADTLHLAWQDTAEEVALFTAIGATGQGCLIIAQGGWGGRQLALHLTQEIALRYRWRRVPG